MVATRQGQGDNPFKGLSSYASLDAAVFCGRQSLVNKAVNLLLDAHTEQHPFLLVLGQSASGKSSLIQAGIIPALNQSMAGTVLCATLPACDLSTDPFKGLVHCLAADAAGNLFAQQHLRDVVAMTRQDPEGFFSLLKTALEAKPAPSRLVLVIPKLEHLYLNPDLNPLQKRYFGDLIARLVSQLGIMVICSLRSDQYHMLSLTPALMSLKQQNGQLDVTTPDLAQLKQIILAPLEGQQVEFEVQQDQSLVDTIANRVLEFPNSLPLLSFLLKKLYELQSADGKIRFSAYRQLGGLDSVLPSCAERVYESLDRSVKRHFNRVFTRLVIRSAFQRYEMQWLPRAELERSERAKQFIQTFIDAGLLTTTFNADGTEVVSLAHECLLQHWPRLVQVLDHHQQQMLLQEKLLQQAKQWETATRPSAYLLSGKQSLSEAKRLLRHDGKVEPAVKALIQASVKRVKRNRLMGYVAGSAVSAAFILVLMQVYSAKTDVRETQARLDESHKLIEFLISDEHQKLTEIGRLDVMADGSEKSLEYLSKVTRDDESSASKLSRSNTFHQIGEVYLETRQYPDALLAFNQALELNQQLLDIHPNGFVYALQLSKAYYWIAETYRLSGQWDKAETAYQSYQKVAYDLVKMKPDDAHAKLELARAYREMAEMAALQEQNERAMQNYLESIKFAEKGRVVATDQQLSEMVESYAWLANRYQHQLKLTEALEMAKGRVLASQSLHNQTANDEHQIIWLNAQWDYAEKLMLVGKNKLAVSVLEDIYQQGSSIRGNEKLQEHAMYLQALSLSRQAQVLHLTGKSATAEERMQQSLAVLNEPFARADESWMDELFERQYWFARIAHDLDESELSLQLRSSLSQAQHQSSVKWQIRLANLFGGSVSAPSIEQQQETSEPFELIAYLEYATLQQDNDSLTLLRDRVPQEMWLYPDLEQIRAQIRQVL